MIQFSDPNFDVDKFLAQFRVTRHRGFLPLSDPLQRLPSDIQGADAYENLVNDLRPVLLAGQIRERVHSLPVFDVQGLRTYLEQERAMLVLSLIGHAYLHGNPDIDIQPTSSLPQPLSTAWCAVADMVGRPAVLTHGSIVVHNWRRLREENDPKVSAADVNVGNITTLNTFGHGWDEDWFYLVTVEIEAKAAPGVVAATEMVNMLAAKTEMSQEQLVTEINNRLKTLGQVMTDMHESLLSMTKQCDPHVFYKRLRPYLAGWKNNPNFPQGVVYEGVSSDPMYFHGGSAAQSAVLHAFDEALGVKHKSQFLAEMRKYMPRDHRALVEQFEQHSSLVRTFVLEHGNDESVALFNNCIELNDKFRTEHVKIVARYIVAQSRNPQQELGTGGTTPMPFLKGVRDEVKPNLIKK